jgi:hypothetical protein
MLMDSLFSVNLVAVIAATIASMVVGSVLYSQAVWGKRWMKLVGVDEKKARKSAGMTIVYAFVLALISSVVLTALIGSGAGLYVGLMNGLIIGAGIAAASVVMHQVFEQKTSELMIMTVVHELITFGLMGAVIGLLG